MLFTSMLIIKITEFSGSFTLRKLSEEQKPTIPDVQELNTRGNQMSVIGSIKVDDSG